MGGVVEIIQPTSTSDWFGSYTLIQIHRLMNVWLQMKVKHFFS